MGLLILVLGSLFGNIDEVSTLDNSPPGRVVRFATFNASLNREKSGDLIPDLSNSDNPQARNLAEIIQRTRPDVVLINEFDPERGAPALFQENYLARGQNGAESIHYAHRYSAPVNTSVATGQDLDGNGKATTEPGPRAFGNDAFGYGLYPGQYGMVLFSRYPIDQGKVRQFRPSPVPITDWFTWISPSIEGAD
jgi:hypothetical protein